MKKSVLTIGHSNHPLERFLELLRQHQVSAVADVRSTPFSRTNPQYNRDALRTSLTPLGITYVFLGKELGARSDDPLCYEAGKVQYDRLAMTDLFLRGLTRIHEGAEKFRLALMCAEREPLDCHRTILVARHLELRGYEVKHIHGSGDLESNSDAIVRLIKHLKIPAADMFRSDDDVIAEAYKRQEERIAYTIRPSGPNAIIDPDVGVTG